MMNHDQWQATDLQLAILQILLNARRKKPATGRASEPQLINLLNLNDVDALRESLLVLTERGFVQERERNFQITADGVDYLEENPPGPSPPRPPGSPESPPGSSPPNTDPDNPAPVPRRRKPSDGAGALALPLPTADNDSV